MSDRIYLVNDRRETPSRQRLVRAATKSQALRHVATSAFNVEVASQNVLVALVSGGVSVETAAAGDAGEG